jgi:hypothetical protein
MTVKSYEAHAGDRIEVSSPGGELPRRGIVTEVLGATGHQRYRVRWLDGHETIHYPSDGTRVRPRAPLHVLEHRHTAAPDGTHRWRVLLHDDVPLEVELQAGEREALELDDDELHDLLPTALDRRVAEDGDHDIPWDEPVRLYADHFRG